MHIPDGFVDAKTAVTMGVLSAAGLGIALRQVNRTLPASKVPLLGLAAAFVFAAQMLNFPVAGGTSGHMVGAVLIAALLGPGAAVVVMSVILIAQCLLFADGGVTALGANVFNMGLVAGVGGWMIYRLVTRVFPGLFGMILAGAFAGWFGTVLASIVCAGELAASNIVPWSTALPAMAGVHLLIGIGEGAITAMVIAAIGKTRPDLLGLRPTGEAMAMPSGQVGFGTMLALGLIISLGLAIFVAPFACPWPDGLEKVAGTLGFEHFAAEEPVVSSPIPDYAMPGVSVEGVATALAGLVGTVFVFAMAWVLAKVLTVRSAPATATSGGTQA
ncbi:MAG: energy-coupling factor ABC transporter permease [Phycisphaeraceae bacterium]|nr:energy-coupling factor ABC transporter permease [Phycisphaeraceae bacterium]